MNRDHGLVSIAGQAGMGLVSRRAGIRTLLHEFSATISREGATPGARVILHRTVDALEALLVAEMTRKSTSRAVASWSLHDPLSAILAELRAIAERWDAADDRPVTSDFAHALDALLVYEIREDLTI
jgi:hypothetical protein